MSGHRRTASQGVTTERTERLTPEETSRATTDTDTRTETGVAVPDVDRVPTEQRDDAVVPPPVSIPQRRPCMQVVEAPPSSLKKVADELDDVLQTIRCRWPDAVSAVDSAQVHEQARLQAKTDLTKRALPDVRGGCSASLAPYLVRDVSPPAKPAESSPGIHIFCDDPNTPFVVMVGNQSEAAGRILHRPPGEVAAVPNPPAVFKPSCDQDERDIACVQSEPQKERPSIEVKAEKAPSRSRTIADPSVTIRRLVRDALQEATPAETKDRLPSGNNTFENRVEGLLRQCTRAVTRWERELQRFKQMANAPATSSARHGRPRRKPIEAKDQAETARRRIRVVDPRPAHIVTPWRRTASSKDDNDGDDDDDEEDVIVDTTERRTTLIRSLREIRVDTSAIEERISRSLHENPDPEQPAQTEPTPDSPPAHDDRLRVPFRPAPRLAQPFRVRLKARLDGIVDDTK
ncbi:Uncharacterized protein PBTT_02039 [Plasmodiophora brassicae]|nr:hypothetical protein PBRA_002560 [Plasmodiophora brassicae]